MIDIVDVNGIVGNAIRIGTPSKTNRLVQDDISFGVFINVRTLVEIGVSWPVSQAVHSAIGEIGGGYAG